MYLELELFKECLLSVTLELLGIVCFVGMISCMLIIAVFTCMIDYRWCTA